MTTQQNSIRARCVSLFRFLRDLTGLRTQPVESLESYEQVLWFADLPREPECDSIASRDRQADDDAAQDDGAAPDGSIADDGPDDPWLAVAKPALRPCPEPPAALAPWLVAESLADSTRAAPELRARIHESTDDGGIVERTFDHDPTVERSFEWYARERWQPWAQRDRRLRKVQEVYTTLFSMHQRQQRLGEEFEIVLGLGLLSWQPDDSRRIRRHLVVADAALEVDPRDGRITVGPGGDGARPRLEQDMLEPSERPPPATSAELERLVRDLGDAVWSPDDVGEICSGWIHAVAADGSSTDALEPPRRVGPAPQLAFAPALLLRKRSDRSLLRTFDEILDQLEAPTETEIPFGVARYVTVIGDERASAPAHARPAPILPGEIERDYLPLPANDEQRAVLARLRTQQGVLVQGPPGTGKSHTIANLVCHLLANGQRVLVTSHTARALEVLRAKLPGGFADLCVDLLGDGRDALQSLEKSVLAITERQRDFDPAASLGTIDAAERALQAAAEREALALLALREAQESASVVHRIDADGIEYAGTLQAIARSLAERADELGWIDDRLDAEQPLPLDADELLELARIAPGERCALFPAVLEDRALDDGWADVADAARALQAAWRASDADPRGFIGTAAASVLRGEDSPWRERLSATREFLAADDGLAGARAIDAMAVRGLGDDLDADMVLQDARLLRAHFEAGSGLGFWIFRKAIVRRTRYLWDRVQIDGRPCRDAESLRALERRIEFDRRLGQLELLWRDVDSRAAPSTTSSRALRCAAFADLLAPLQRALDVEAPLSRLRAAIDALTIEDTAALARAVELKVHDRAELAEFETFAEQTRIDRELAHERAELDRKIDALERTGHSDAAALADALRRGDEVATATATARLADLDLLHVLRERLARAGAPQLASAIANPESSAVRHRASLAAAWAWRRAHSYVLDHQTLGREAELRDELAARQNEQRTLLLRLAEARAWHHLLTSLDEAKRQHLIAWTKAMRRIGKGTGKHAGRHRRAAREHMEQCRSAIPAWILPIYRVAESIRPGTDAFDVVIIDEASQSGPEALFLLYLCKQIIVVGDDKQISPDYVGITRDDVEHLRVRHLADLPHSDAFSLEHSLFDLAEIRYGNRVRLREHFRCMPEIIRFSNDLCYRAEPLLPLKQFGAGRLTPVVTTRHVAAGYRDGTETKVVNPPEADAIVAQLLACHADPAYAGKTFGVISLQGPFQAQLIESRLLQELGPEAVLARQLVCGDAYAFQGDERDVMMLSLVAAPHAERRIGVLADQRSERRFNVAVSRAKEQLWLFHTATLADLSPKCLRHTLLEYCLDPRAKSTLPTGIDEAALRILAARRDRRGTDEPPQPFDSWFEVDVCLALTARGFRVEPQFDVAGYRIDLVVIGAARRVGVECDGDRWHGAAQFENDASRQRQLERCGWKLVRIRGSEFYLDPAAALAPLWQQLEALAIEPQ